MSPVSIVARKELRANFESAVALIFLGIFLLATLFSFFGFSNFFARNIGDVRPLFAWLPLLLIPLVAAISMRQWAEERKMGTLEVLLTLPVRTRDMVLGKFLAGMALIAVALAMTLPIPLMVSMLADLDWGPVMGGYLGALLLGGTYLSIGLCVSARTDNQVVALMLTLVIAGALYFLGSDILTQYFGMQSADLLRSLGSGSRFLSIERGVLDLRDLAYYLGLSAFFLSLNWYFLESERIDHRSDGGRSQTRQLQILIGLVGLNVVALGIWLAPVNALRIDMTQRGEYSISRVSKAALLALPEPLVITGYFSERTHPALAPLVPQIKDLLTEYALAGGDRVRLSFVDPNLDEAIEQEIGERYGIRSVPFRVADRHQQAVVNSFFHILIGYGDQNETLSFDELIEVRFDNDELDVRLRNLEYDLTRTVRRVSRDFQSLESLFDQLPADTRLTAYFTPATMPSDFAEVPERVRTIAKEIENISRGRFHYEEVDPSQDPELRRQLSEQYGIRPLAVDLFGRTTFYLDLVFSAGDQVQRISPRSDLTEADLQSAIEAAIRRATPGQLKTVGLFTHQPPVQAPNPQLPPMMQPPPPQQDYRGLEQFFSEDYRVERTQLSDGLVPETFDVLIVGKPGPLTQKQQFAIDQFLMRGGRLVVLAGRYVISANQGGLRAASHESELFDMLDTWGVAIAPALVMDPQNAPFPVPVQEQRGMFRVQRVHMLPYPFFPDIRQDGFNPDHPSLIGLQNVTTPWASPLTLAPPEGVSTEILLTSSPGTWLNQTGAIEPDLRRYPDVGFAPGGDIGPQILAAALEGTFPSNFVDRASPIFDGDGEAAEGEIADATGRTIKESLSDARLVVVGSAELVSDLMVQMASQMGGEVHRGDLQLVQNVIDWMVEDTDLLTIRSTGSFARTLVPLSEAEIRSWEAGSYGVVALLLGIVTFLPRRRRKMVRPIQIEAQRPATGVGEGTAS
jgi:ABC-2 type transport system permease protein